MPTAPVSLDDLDALVLAGRYGDALGMARALAASSDELHEQLSAEVVEAWCLSRLGDDVAALELVSRVYDEGCAQLGASDPVTLTALDRRARFKHRLGMHTEALHDGATAYQLRRQALGADHRDSLRSATNLLRYRLGRGDQPSLHDAEMLLDQWHRIDPERRDPAHLAAMHLEMRLRRRILASDAASLLERYRSTLGPDHPDTVRAAESLGPLLG